LLVLAIVGMSYGPYVLWLPHTTLWSYFCVGVFHVLVFLLVASYTMCVFTDPGSTPAEWSRLVASDSNLASEHRLCSRTSMYRPLRSHFCSVTRRVVLNMDHFCPWVVNTVGFYNRKFFILFLLYTLLSTMWVLLTSMPLLLQLYGSQGTMRALERKWGSSKFMISFMGVMLDGCLCVMLACFCPFHIRMAMLNETTIEGPSPAFDVGMRKNWQQVFGKNAWLWFLPVYGGGPDGDGLHWPSRHAKSPAQEEELEEGRLLSQRDNDSDLSN